MDLDSKKTKRKSGLGWMLGAALLFVATKGKNLLVLLKFSKFGSALISMLVTIWAYTLVFPAQVAVGLVAMILIHEIGHVVAAKQKGLPVSAPFFIPFIGALIMMKRHPRDALTEAYVAYGGPFWGTIGATAAFGVGWYGVHQFGGAGWYIWIVIAKIGFFLNLFNMLPMKPLDGGRIASAISRWLWIVGLIGGALAIIMLKAWLLILFWVLFAVDLYKTYIRKTPAQPTQYTLRWEIPLQPLLDQGFFIPGEEHRRELPFTTWSTLEGTQKLTLYWDSLGLEHTVELPGQAIVEKVEVHRVEQNSREEGPYLAVSVGVYGQAHESEQYYEVPTRARLGYSVAYFGLAAYLLFMLWVVGSVEAPVLD